MNARQTGGRPVDPGERRVELERAFLSVQGERVALTAAFMRLTVESGPAGIELVIVRLLRLQRAVEKAQAAAFIPEETALNDANFARPQSLTTMFS